MATTKKVSPYQLRILRSMVRDSRRPGSPGFYISRRSALPMERAGVITEFYPGEGRLVWKLTVLGREIGSGE